MTNALNVKFVTPPGDEVGLTSAFVRVSVCGGLWGGWGLIFFFLWIATF